MRIIKHQPVVVAAAAPVEPYIPNATETPGLSMAQVFAMLKAHRKLAAIIAAVIIVLTAGVIKMLPKAYTATATMIASYQVTQGGGTEVPSWLIGTYMATQVELMTSSEVLLPVVDQLGLTKDSEFTDGFRGGDSTALRTYAVGALGAHLLVEQGKGSQLLYVTATSRVPAKAALIANTVADMYSKREKQRLKDPADDRAKNYSEQLAELQAKVTAAQQKVTELRQQTGTAPIANPNSNGVADSDEQTLISLEQQLLAAQNLRRSAETATNIAPVGSNGQGVGSPEVRELTSEITTKELQLSELRATYGARHPKVLELESNISQARHRLAEEQTQYLNDARQIEAKLQQAVNAQQAKILAIRKVQDQGAKLQLELESSQSVYKRALDGYDQIMFASASNPTNVSFVSRAAIPVEPAKPSAIKLMLIGTILAILFAMAAPVLYELIFDRRLHCKDDFERHFGIPVLAQFGAGPMQMKASR
jgi:succinoglycan biosynthesis transport protein ExoP